jgi:hypothetical protein
LFIRLFLGNKTSTPSIFAGQTCLGRGERLKFEAKFRNKLCYAVGWLKLAKKHIVRVVLSKQLHERPHNRRILQTRRHMVRILPNRRLPPHTIRPNNTKSKRFSMEKREDGWKLPKPPEI